MTWHPGVLVGSKSLCNSSFIASKAWATDSVMGSQPEGHLQTLWSFATCSELIVQKRHATGKRPEPVGREQELLPKWTLVSCICARPESNAGDVGMMRYMYGSCL
jgi:hypothetical protein